MHRLLIAASALALAVLAAPGSAQVIRDGRWVDPAAPEPAPPPPPEVAPPPPPPEAAPPPPPQHAPPPPPEIAVPAPPPAPPAKPREPQVVFAPRNPVVQPVDTVPVAPSTAPSSDLPSVADSAPGEPVASPRQVAGVRAGQVLSRAWLDPRFVVSDYDRWNLPEPGPDEHWIRQYDDAVLVGSDDRVVDRIEGVDWDAAPRGYADRGPDTGYDDAYAQAPDEGYGAAYPPPRGDAGYRGPEHRYRPQGRYQADHPPRRVPPPPPPRVTVDGCDHRCGGTRVETYYSGGGYISGGYYYPPATTTVVTIAPATTTTRTEQWDEYDSGGREYHPRRRRVQRIR